MNNIEIIDVIDPLTNDATQHVIIDRGNGEYTSMTKAHYDELQAQTNRIGVVTNGDN